MTLQIINTLFFRITYGTSPKELQGIKVKIDSGQIPAGMVRRIILGKFLEVDGDSADAVCKKALDETLGEYSPTSKKDPDPEAMSSDTVDVEASVGDQTYDGKVSLDYFYSDLIFRLHDSGEDASNLDQDLMERYSASVEMLATIYPFLLSIRQQEGESVFDDFITNLHYAGFYGVTSSEYYVVPCTPQYLEVYSTTQGFRALLKMKSMPSDEMFVPSVKAQEDREDVEVDLVAANQAAVETEVEPDQDTR